MTERKILTHSDIGVEYDNSGFVGIDFLSEWGDSPLKNSEVLPTIQAMISEWQSDIKFYRKFVTLLEKYSPERILSAVKFGRLLKKAQQDVKDHSSRSGGLHYQRLREVGLPSLRKAAAEAEKEMTPDEKHIWIILSERIS